MRAVAHEDLTAAITSRVTTGGPGGTEASCAATSKGRVARWRPDEGVNHRGQQGGVTFGRKSYPGSTRPSESVPYEDQARKRACMQPCPSV